MRVLRYVIRIYDSAIEGIYSNWFDYFQQGPVRFYNNERRANILLKQFQVDKEVKIGEFNSIENKLMFESGEPMKWVSLTR